VEIVNLAKKLARFTDHWAPKIVGQINDYHIKLVKIDGEFVWHAHPHTDELFMVLRGEMEIAFRDQVVQLCEGEVLVVPKGVEHKPRAAEECHILLIEPAGTLNTGDAGGERSVAGEDWI
jgi:mannose-6-phosphate isomerase-like protein (cupin superfamily)